ncbi:MAG: hypothetical protein ACE5DO_05005 [Desulfobacterales bacterium]
MKRIMSTLTSGIVYSIGSSNSTKVTASVEVQPYEDFYFDVSLTISHEFGVPLEYVIFPSDLVFKNNKIEEALLPVIPGVILERSFFQESRSYTTKYPGWPGVFSDFVSIKLNNSSYTVYSIYQPENPIPVVEIGLVNDDDYIPKSTYSKHVYRTYIPDKKEWASPTVRIHIGQKQKWPAAN